MRRFIPWIVSLFSVVINTSAFAFQDVEALKHALTQAEDQENQVKVSQVHFRLGSWYQEQDLDTLALEHYYAALAAVPSTPLPKLFSQIYIQIGIIYYWRDQYDLALDYLFKAERLLNQYNTAHSADTLNQLLIKNLKYISDSYIQIGDFENAQTYQLSVLSKSKLINDSLGIANAYLIALRINGYMEDYTSSIRNAHLSLKYVDKTRHPKHVYTCLSSLALNYIYTKELDSAFLYATQSLELADSIGLDYGIAYSKGCIGQIYMYQNKYQIAHDMLQESIQSFRAKNIKREALDMTHKLAENYAAQKKYQQAIDILEGILPEVRSIQATPLERDIYQKLAVYYDNQGQNDQAQVAENRFFHLSDSLMGPEINQRLHQIEIQSLKNSHTSYVEQLRNAFLKDRNKMYLWLSVLIGLIIASIGGIFAVRNHLEKKRKALVKKYHQNIYEQDIYLSHAYQDLKNIATCIRQDLHPYLTALQQAIGQPPNGSSGNASAPLEKFESQLAHLDIDLQLLYQYTIAGVADEDTCWVDMKNLVWEIKNHLHNTHHSPYRKFLARELPAIKANKEKIQILLEKLLSYFIHLKGDDPLDIEINSNHHMVNSQETYVEILITSNGKAIPDDAIPHLFTFDLHSYKTDFFHFGAALAICARIVRHYGGGISVFHPTHSGNGILLRFPKDRVRTYATLNGNVNKQRPQLHPTK